MVRPTIRQTCFAYWYFNCIAFLITAPTNGFIGIPLKSRAHQGTQGVGCAASRVLSRVKPLAICAAIKRGKHVPPGSPLSPMPMCGRQSGHGRPESCERVARQAAHISGFKIRPAEGDAGDVRQPAPARSRQHRTRQRARFKPGLDGVNGGSSGYLHALRRSLKNSESKAKKMRHRR